MIKRHSAPGLIRARKQQYFIKIICLLAVILGTQTVAIQLQITQDAHASSQQGAAVVPLPDPNLRAAIAEELGKSPNSPITAVEMTTLRELEVPGRGIRNLAGLQFATNLRRLHLSNWEQQGNDVSDLSPIAGLIELRDLFLSDNPISDLSPLRGLNKLSRLVCKHTKISDLSPLAGLTNLRHLDVSGNASTLDLSPIARLINLQFLAAPEIVELSPVAGLINLTDLFFSGNDNITDLSPVAGLINLGLLHSGGNAVSDLSPLARLTELWHLYLPGAEISDLTPLAGLTSLRELYLHHNDISDISPLAGLTGLTRMRLEHNNISDISPLTGLTNLKWMAIDNNNISDFSPLDGIRENIKLIWYDNPAFPKGGPKIEGPWLWVVLPNVRRDFDSGADLLSAASGDAVTEMMISTHGAAEGNAVGTNVWTSYRLPPTGQDNIEDMLKRVIPEAVIYGTVSLYSPREQETTMYVGSDYGAKVWLNGTLMYEDLSGEDGDDYHDFFPVTLTQGVNVLLVAVHIYRAANSAFFGFSPGTEYREATPSVSYIFSKTPVHRSDTFTLDIGAKDVFDMAGWQFDIAFDPAILEAINVTEGDFLKKDGVTTFFQGGTINNASGKITGLNAARLSTTRGVSGTGTLLQVMFEAKSAGETVLELQNLEFGDVTGTLIPAGPHEIRITVGGQIATGDANRDGVVSILDLILIARQLGQRVSANSPVDLNGDGAVSVLDLILAARSLGDTTAPSAPAVGAKSVDATTIEAWIIQARLEDDGSLAFKQGIENLQYLLASLIPEETALLASYPNPFNPETWIPYQLAESAEVTLTIHDINGKMVRRMTLGHRAAGVYTSRNRAAYWDGRNQLGEPVASGLYFYTLTARPETGANDFTTTRRMLMLK